MATIIKTEGGSWTAIATLLTPARHEFQNEEDRQISDLNDIIHYIEAMEVKQRSRKNDKFFWAGIKNLFHSVLDAYEHRTSNK